MGFHSETYYDILEIQNGATLEEVRKAYKKVKEIYSPNSLAIYGIFTVPQLEAMQKQIQLAFDTLNDPGRRKNYDLMLLREGRLSSVFPEGDSQIRQGEEDAAGGVAQPAMVEEKSAEADDGLPGKDPVEYTGEFLKALRLKKGVDLKDIASKTKIGIAQLKNIEEDNFAALEAPVYIRGFLIEYAKYLKLDKTLVSKSYLRRYHDYLNHKKDPYDKTNK